MKLLNKALAKHLIAPAAVAALTVAGSPLAYAGSTAYTQLEVTSGIFYRADTGNALQLGTDMTIITFEERGVNDVERLAGAGAGSADDTGVDTNPNNGVLLGPASLGATGTNVIEQVCVGTGCGAAPNFPNPFVQGNLASDEYLRAAMLVSGTGLDLSVVTGGAIGVDSNSTQLVAEAITQGTADDIGLSSLANSTKFTVTFTALDNVKVGFKGTVDRAMDLFLDPIANGGTAIGKLDFGFTVFNVSDGIQVAITAVNDPTLTLSTQTQGAGGRINFSNNLAYDAQTNTALVAGKQYQLTLAWNVRSDLNVEVPEPAPLGLLGLGLLAIPMVRRWKARG